MTARILQKLSLPSYLRPPISRGGTDFRGIDRINRKKTVQRRERSLVTAVDSLPNWICSYVKETTNEMWLSRYLLRDPARKWKERLSKKCRNTWQLRRRYDELTIVSIIKAGHESKARRKEKRLREREEANNEIKIHTLQPVLSGPRTNW